MFEIKRDLKAEQTPEPEKAWDANHEGTSSRTKEAAEARRQAGQALEAGHQRSGREKLQVSTQGKALDKRDELDRRHAEAMLVWQMRYLESRVIKDSLRKVWQEVEREVAGGDGGQTPR